MQKFCANTANANKHRQWSGGCPELNLKRYALAELRRQERKMSTLGGNK